VHRPIQRHAEEAGRLDGRDAHRPVGDVNGLVEVVEQEAYDLGKAQRDDGQIVALQPQHRKPQQEAHAGGGDEAEHQKRPEPVAGQRVGAKAHELGRLPGREDAVGVRAHRVERRVAQVQKPRVAHHDVEAHRQDRVDTHHRRNVREGAAGRADDGHDHREVDRGDREPHILGQVHRVQKHQREQKQHERDAAGPENQHRHRRNCDDRGLEDQKRARLRGR